MSWAEIVSAAEAIRDSTAAGSPSVEGRRITGIAWATVEAERAFGELATILGEAEWAPQERDALLGSRVWRRNPSLDGATALFVVEPDTEGRLAANLARFGEGVGAVFLAGSGEGDRLVALDPRWGPYVIVRSRSG